MHRADVVPLDDLSPADWLREVLVDFGGRVREVVPTAGYAAVARVLHRVDPTADRRWSDVAASCGTTLHPQAQFWMLAGTHERSAATRRWREGTEPDTGSLDPVSLAALRDVLARHTTTPSRCWFALWEGSGGLPQAWRASPTVALPGRNHHLFAGALADVVEISVEFECAGLEDAQPPGTSATLWASTEPREPPTRQEIADAFRAAGHLRSPSLWWPDDRAWCVASEIDFDSTLVAGSAAVVAELVDHPDLEAFEVAPDDSLTFDGDSVNMR